MVGTIHISRNKASYFSASHNFDHSESNCIQHVPHESPKSKDFEGIDDEEEEYDGDKSSQQFNSNENNQNVGQSGDYDQRLNDWDDNFPPSEEFERTDEDFQGTIENDGEIPSSGNFKSSEDDYDNGGPNSQVENLKTTMLVIMIFLLVRILRVLMKSFLQMRISKA